MDRAWSHHRRRNKSADPCGWCSAGITFALLFIANLPAVVEANAPPRFRLSDNEILLKLREGPETPRGSRICSLFGEDPDGDFLHFGVRGQVGNELLRIDSVNSTAADVFLMRELDRETQDEYQLILTLTDGVRGNLIEQSMHILVEDINDNQPMFKPYNATIYIKENSPPGLIATLEATDLDEGSFGQVVYSLQDSDDNLGNFKIATVNGRGELSLVKMLDYEQKFVYQLQVLAVDRANTGRRNTGTAALVVKVQDMEDQPPEFLKVPSVTKVPEDLPVGARILEVWAVDGDRGVNNNVHYSIINGDNNLFGIERESGWVFVENRLDREAGDRNGAYVLGIRATEVGSQVTPVPAAETEVTILLVDINDETPRFRSDAYVGQVSENAQLNVPITFVGSARPEIYDYDQGKNGTFELSLEGDEGIFEITPFQVINEAAFLIRVKNQSLLDYEKTKTLQFTMVAREVTEVEPKSSSAAVTVNVLDANDNVPEFESSEYVSHVKEDARAGSSVAKIAAFDRDSGDFGTAGIRYTEIRGQIADKLSLDAVTGLITMALDAKTGDLDREVVSTHYLTVEARDDLGRGNRNTVQLQLVVEDVNDNAPHFLQSSYETRISENELSFRQPLIVEASDKDLPGSVNSELRFAILAGDPRHNFSINEYSGQITLNSPLDYEAMNASEELRFFNLTVQASDMGQPPLHSNVSVLVYVQDENDHAPIFSDQIYNATVREDIRPGDAIIQIHAHDNDGSASNSRIVYRIVSGAVDKFTLQADGGVLSVAKGASLDPDLTDPNTYFYVLEVAAVDGGIGDQQWQTNAKVNISVTDVNNKVPHFREPGTVSVAENSPVGTLVTKLVADDEDSSPDLRFALDPAKCEARNEDGALVRLLPTDYSALFDVTQDGLVKVRGVLDREFTETIKLKVTVEDRNAVGLRQMSTGTLTVKVEDVNDNEPVFQKLLYRRAVPENSKPGTHILNVAADDRDVNRTLLYKLRGPDNIVRHVSLDPHSGELVVRNKMDREQFSWLNFSIIATDNGAPPRSASTNVSVQILDENDNNPVFLEELYSFQIPEDMPVGSQIGVIQAQDADAGEYGDVTYLLDKRTTFGKFTINPETGALTVAEPLDRETRDKYMLVVEAWDNYELGFATRESRNAFKQVIVSVSDVNDNRPELMTNTQTCISVTEYHKVGESLTTIKADDADQPDTPNARVDFTITSGNDKGLFALESVDGNTARLLAAKSLKQQIGNHTLGVQVQDRGDPPLSSQGDVFVCILDFNDHAPQFVRPLQNVTIRIAEDTPVGTSVSLLEALDDDMGVNGEVRYNILEDQRGDWRTFKVDALTGLISLSRPLDREIQKKFEIRVEAHDLGIPTPLASDMDLSFYVKNVIDVEPHFSSPEMIITFMENVEPGKEVEMLPETVDVEEYDFDSDKATICYFIVGGNEEGMFEVDAVRHEVSTRVMLDREERDMYMFIVRASKECGQDSSPPQRLHSYDVSDRTLLRVTVKVLDENDNSPYFVRDIFTGGMATDTVYATPIMRVKAIDRDAGENGRLHYFIPGAIRSTLSEEFDNLGSHPFIMNQSSGEVLLNFYPQKTMKGYFHFPVSVNDSDGLMDKAQVMIYLVRQDQKLKFTVRLTPDELRPRVDKFQNMLSNLTETIVNIDAYKYHESTDGSVDKTKSDVYVHFVHRYDNSIMNVEEATRLIDKRIEVLNSLFQEYNVLEGKPAVSQELVTGPEEIVIAWLIGSTAGLGILLVLVLSICITQKNRYERQLKAATAIAFGSQDSNLNRTNVPNTNQHSIEGSNPIWMHSYENEWYKADEDNLSVRSESSDGDNSLDENVIIDTDADPSETSTTHTAGGYSTPSTPNTITIATTAMTTAAGVVDGTTTCAPRTKQVAEAQQPQSPLHLLTESKMNNALPLLRGLRDPATDLMFRDGVKEQNDLNKSAQQQQQRRHNIYESLGINGNTILSHIETTEL